MDKIGRGECARYGLLLDAIVDGTLVLDDNGKVTAPEQLAKKAARFPETLMSPEARQLLAAHIVDSMATATTVTQLQRLLAGAGGRDSQTTTFVALPIMRVCRERRAATVEADGEHKDLVVNPYRMLRADGSLIVDAPEGWQPSAAVLDLMAIYHMHYYLACGIDDDEALTQFVYRYVDLLNPVVLWEYINTGIDHFLTTGEGNITRYLNAIELRDFGRKLHAREAFNLYLDGNEKEGRAHLVARGFVDP